MKTESGNFGNILKEIVSAQSNGRGQATPDSMSQHSRKSIRKVKKSVKTSL